MPIPALNEHGHLPEGIFECDQMEAQKRFGQFQESGRRPELWHKLALFMAEARRSGVVIEILVDGSFVTSKAIPNDIDLIVVVTKQHDFAMDLSPSEYNVLSKRRVFRRYGFDTLVARAESVEYQQYVDFFQQIRLEPEQRKGIIRIRL